ncbi:MAG: MBL fold metallo-hydrolase [Chloroflexota bacterium]|nr:MBL fold metallo-hydrolase [Chloroflexota bacterium]
MRVTSLGSGSSGNALLVEAGPQGRTKILVDAGISIRQLLERLRQVGISATQLQGIFITHEHSDHVVALPTLLKRYTIPLFSASETLAALESGWSSGIWRSDSGTLVAPDAGREIFQEHENDPFSGDRMRTLAICSSYRLGDIDVLAFPVSHDAAAPCGYLLSAGGCRVCIVLDSGEVTSTMLEAMQQADLLILESNHERERLLRGPYSYQLKQRILSSTGHLSNSQAAEAVLRTWRPDGVRWLWLAHLSRTNNTPKLALQSMLTSLQAANANLSQIHISVLPPGMGSVWDSTQLWHVPSLWNMEQNI